MKHPRSRYSGRVASALSSYLLAGVGLFISSAFVRAHAASFLSDPLHTSALVAKDQASAWNRPGAVSPCALEPKTDRVLTLVDVVNRALCANPQTREVWANAQVQAALLGSARAAYLPTLSLSASAARTQTSSSGGISFPMQTTANPDLALNYLLFDFGGREAAVRSARESLLAADWTHNATLQSVMLAAIQAYYQLFATRAAVSAARDATRSSLEAYNAASFRYQVGAAALSDKLQAQTAYSQAMLNEQTAEGNARIAQGGLANVLGLDADSAIRIAPPALQAPGPAETRGVHRLIEQAKRERPDLAAAQAQIQAARANIEAARAGGRPSISLFGNYGYNYSSTFNDTRNWAFGLSVSVPLFSGFATTYKVESARAQLESQVAQRDLLAQQVTLDVWKAYQNLKTASDTYSSSLDLVQSASQSAEVALGRYKAGVGSILDLLSAEASLANARLQQIQAQYNWYIARVTLAQATGQLDMNTITAEPAAKGP